MATKVASKIKTVKWNKNEQNRILKDLEEKRDLYVSRLEKLKKRYEKDLNSYKAKAKDDKSTKDDKTDDENDKQSELLNIRMKLMDDLSFWRRVEERAKKFESVSGNFIKNDSNALDINENMVIYMYYENPLYFILKNGFYSFDKNQNVVPKIWYQLTANLYVVQNKSTLQLYDVNFTKIKQHTISENNKNVEIHAIAFSQEFIYVSSAKTNKLYQFNFQLNEKHIEAVDVKGICFYDEHLYVCAGRGLKKYDKKLKLIETINLPVLQETLINVQINNNYAVLTYSTCFQVYEIKNGKFHKNSQSLIKIQQADKYKFANYEKCICAFNGRTIHIFEMRDKVQVINKISENERKKIDELVHLTVDLTSPNDAHFSDQTQCSIGTFNNTLILHIEDFVAKIFLHNNLNK